MKKIKIMLLIILLLTPYLLIYKSFFLGGILAWGDSPFYYPENLRELFNQPFVWDIRNSNFGAPQFTTLWLYIPTFLVGALGTIFNLDSQHLLRTIFYFPATILALFGSWKFISLFTKDKLAKILGVFLYSFNTYNLMLIDGGQIGVALGYGIFPLVVYRTFKFFSNQTLNNFLLALFGVFLLSNIDLRLALICVLLIILFKLFEQIGNVDFSILKKNLYGLGLILLCTIGLDLFWIIPFIYGALISQAIISYTLPELNQIKLIDALLLHQPSFPLNEFGKTLPIPFYFTLLPLLIFLGSIIKKDSRALKLSLLFLLFVFLTKGNNQPFGEIYSWLISNLSMGTAFRDSSKFFIPLLIIGSLLLSLSFEKVGKKLSESNKKIFWLGIYIYLLFLIYPALLGNLTGGLNNKVNVNNYINIHNFLTKEEDFSRTLWFSENPPLAFNSWNKPALSANELVKDRPFATLTEGSYDLFGFLHDKNLKEWFNLLGVKYAFFPENERQKTYTKKQLDERVEFLNFIDTIPNFKKINLGTNFPSYQIEGNYPHIFAQKKILIVQGGEDIYRELFKNEKFSIANQGFVFLEQGLIDPKILLNLKRDSVDLVFMNKKELVFSFLGDKMISTLDSTLNEWAKKDTSQYLKWKGDLSERGINTLDFDYQKGISYSTIKDEKIKFNLSLPKDGNYILALRYTNASSSAGLKVSTNSLEENIYSKDFNRFHWVEFKLPSQKRGKLPIEVTNLGGVVALNTVSLINEDEFNEALFISEKLGKKFSNYFANNSDQRIFDKTNYLEVDHRQINPTLYKLTLPEKANWLVFTDHYNKDWLLGNEKPLPFYAMVNGFYLGNQERNNLILEFKSQRLIKIGVLSSAGSVILLAIYTFIRVRKKFNSS